MATDYTADTNTKLACEFEDAAASGTIVDSSTFASNGTINNSTGVTQHVTGKYDYGVRTSAGNNAKATFTANAADNLSSISLCVWMYNYTYGSVGTITDKGTIWSKGYRSGTFGFFNTDQLGWAEHWAGGTVYWKTTGGPTALSTTQHYAVTYNRSSTTNDPIIYVDGVSQAIAETGGPPFSPRDDDSGDSGCIFQDSLDGGETNSIMDELIIYGGILTSTQINEIKDNGVDGTHGATNVTVTPSVLNLDAKTLTVIFPVSLASSILAPTVSVSSNVSISPEVLSLASSIIAPSITVVSNITTTPSTLTLVSGIVEPVLSTEVVVIPGVLSLVSSVLAPDVSTEANITIAAEVLSLSSSVIAPSVSYSCTVSSSVLTISSEVITPDVSTSNSISLDILTLISNAVAPTISYSTTIESEVLNFVSNILAPSIDIGGSVTITPGVLEILVGLFSPSISGDLSISPDSLSIVGSILSPTISTGSSVSINPSVLTVVSSLSGITILVGNTVSLDALTLVSDILTPSLSMGSTIALNVLSASLGIDSPVINLDFTVSAGVLNITAAVYTPSSGNIVSVTVTPSNLSFLASALAPTVDAELLNIILRIVRIKVASYIPMKNKAKSYINTKNRIKEYIKNRINVAGSDVK